jgi:lipopolysaccharide transport system ATP-binding protein
MTVRLAFAVAAHLEPDILVIDEVLAVGDAEFQKKAVGKMQDISQGEGRTVLFVSHNMAAVKSLCTRAIVLEHGKTAFEGETDKAIYHYLEKNIPKIESVEISNLSREGLGNILLNKIIIANESQIMTGKELKINLVFEIYKKGVIPNRIGITISNKEGVKIININTSLTKETINFHKTEYSCLIPNLPLVEGNYRISVAVFSVYGLEDYLEEIKGFYVNGYDFYGNGKTVDAKYGIVVLNHEWN